MLCVDRTGQFPVMGKRIAHGLSPSTDIVWATGQRGIDRFKFIEGWIDCHTEGYTGVQLDRSVTFVRPDYFIVRDTAASRDPKRVELLWHALSKPESNLAQTGRDTATFRSAPKAPFITSDYFKGRYREGTYDVDLTTHSYDAGAQFVIPRRNAKLAMHVVKPRAGQIGWGPAANPNDKGERSAYLISVEPKRRTANQNFITLLEPFSRRSTQTIRSSQVQKPAVGTGDAVIVNRSNNRRDLLLYAAEKPQKIGYDRFSVTAGIGILQQRANDAFSASAAGSVTEIVLGDERLFAALQPVDFASLEGWSTEKRSLHLQAAADRALTVRLSKRPAQVWLNNESVKFEYDAQSGEVTIHPGDRGDS